MLDGFSPVLWVSANRDYDGLSQIPQINADIFITALIIKKIEIKQKA